MRCTGVAAHRTRLTELPVHGHLRPKRGDLLGKSAARFGAKAVGPLDERRARRVEERRDLVVGQAAT